MFDVEVNHVTKKYGSRVVVDDVSFTVSGHESWVLSARTAPAKLPISAWSWM